MKRSLNQTKHAPMTIQTETSADGIFLVKLAGRMDAEGVPGIEPTLLEHACAQSAVIVDLQGVDFLASVGIRTMLVVAKAVAKRGGKLVLLHPTPNIAKVLQVAGVDSLLPIHHSMDDARRAVAG